MDSAAVDGTRYSLRGKDTVGPEQAGGKVYSFKDAHFTGQDRYDPSAANWQGTATTTPALDRPIWAATASVKSYPQATEVEANVTNAMKQASDALVCLRRNLLLIADASQRKPLIQQIQTLEKTLKTIQERGLADKPLSRFT